MVLQLTLPAEVEVRLRHEAERSGEPAESVALRLLDQNLPPQLDARRSAAINMLGKWMEEDAKAGDSEEAEEFFQSLDAHHTSDRSLFPAEWKGITW